MGRGLQRPNLQWEMGNISEFGVFSVLMLTGVISLNPKVRKGLWTILAGEFSIKRNTCGGFRKVSRTACPSWALRSTTLRAPNKKNTGGIKRTIEQIVGLYVGVARYFGRGGLVPDLIYDILLLGVLLLKEGNDIT